MVKHDLKRSKRYKIYIAYMENLKNIYKWTSLQNKNRLTDIENKHGYEGGKGGRW